MPSINTPGSCSEAAGEKTTLSSGDAWLALQREMGTFKADNRMFLRGKGKGCGSGTSAHALRASRSAVGVLKRYLVGTSSPGSSAVSVLTKPPGESSTVCAGEITDLLAKTLSLGLDIPVPAWKRGKTGKVSASKAIRIATWPAKPDQPRFPPNAQISDLVITKPKFAPRLAPHQRTNLRRFSS